MIEIEYNGQNGYFLTEDQKRQIDKLLIDLSQIEELS